MRRRDLLRLALCGPVALVLPAVGDDGVVRRRLRFTITFTNPHPHDLADQQFACYLPADLGVAQRLHGVEVSMPHQVAVDRFGHRVLSLGFDRFPRLGQKVVTVITEVHSRAMPVSGGEVLASRKEWLGAERFVETGAPAIVALAASLKRVDETECAYEIYQWVRRNLNYAGFLPEDRGALYAIDSRRGDCTEYAQLVVALARANGLPARMAGGYVVDHDQAPRSQDYHNWAEIHLEGAWRMVDAQKENWLSPAAQYVVFRIYRDVASNAVGNAHRFRMQGQLDVRM